MLCEGKNVEIQVRTELRQLWAELCEKLSDLLDPAIKYGGGTEEVRNTLAALTAATVAIESQEVGLADTLYQESPFGPKLFDERLIKQQHLRIQREKHMIFLRYREIMDNLSQLKVKR